VAPAEVDDAAHLLGGFGKHHRIGRRVRKVRLVFAVMLAHAPRGRDAIAEQRPHLFEQRSVEFAGLVQDDTVATNSSSILPSNRTESLRPGLRA